MISDRLTYGRKAPWQATRRERKRGRDLTWTLRGMPAPEWCVENWPGSATILAVRSKGIREGKAVDEIRYDVTSLRTSAQALLQHVRDRWSIENSWHCPAIRSSVRTPTATAKSTASRSWPRCGAWP